MSRREEILNDDDNFFFKPSPRSESSSLQSCREQVEVDVHGAGKAVMDKTLYHLQVSFPIHVYILIVIQCSPLPVKYLHLPRRSTEMFYAGIQAIRGP
ncbi:uncharacterized protein ARMOST_18310 [Armillaria ostoyae]|uniref:Uncharacterized protein n=1 Tax=Armillaria ostoyae TaxID=47428 RepID=A0A284S1G8_ARMOS|nr:uncharacterized protein ARMOST_18310 [Armillaria ostoyae]